MRRIQLSINTLKVPSIALVRLTKAHSVPRLKAAALLRCKLLVKVNPALIFSSSVQKRAAAREPLVLANQRQHIATIHNTNIYTVHLMHTLNMRVGHRVLELASQNSPITSDWSNCCKASFRQACESLPPGTGTTF